MRPGNNLLQLGPGCITSHPKEAGNSSGKWALGQPTFNVANEFIEGELGWASYECREAKSKILYFARVGRMPTHRWPKAILDSMVATNNFSNAYIRMLKLCELYECDAMRTRFTAEEQYSWGSFRKDVNDRTKAFTDEESREGMESKSSLERYRQFRINRGTIDHV